MASDDVAVLTAIYVLLMDEEKQREKEKLKRSKWIRPWLARREERGFFHQLFQDISVEDTPAFFKLMRMRKQQFRQLVDMLHCRLAR